MEKENKLEGKRRWEGPLRVGSDVERVWEKRERDNMCVFISLFVLLSLAKRE